MGPGQRSGAARVCLDGDRNGDGAACPVPLPRALALGCWLLSWSSVGNGKSCPSPPSPLPRSRNLSFSQLSSCSASSASNAAQERLGRVWRFFPGTHLTVCKASTCKAGVKAWSGDEDLLSDAARGQDPRLAAPLASI